jgi:hypothetical protein
MAYANVYKYKFGRDLLDKVVLMSRTGMRRSVDLYRDAVASGNLIHAAEMIKRGVDLPHRARWHIDQAIAQYGQQEVIDAVKLVLGTTSVTLAEINADLAAQEAYALTLVNHVRNDAWTWDQVAADIEANVVNEGQRWQFSLAGYIDVWGE